MKKISNWTSQLILLEGFGTIEIKELPDTDGRWQIDLFPQSGNDSSKLLLEVHMKGDGDKYFASIDNVRDALRSPEVS